MAEFNMNCPGCGTELELLDQWRGMEVDCPQCGTTFKVPMAFDAGGEQDIPLAAAPPSNPVPEAYPGALPLYMQQSEAQKSYKRQRGLQNGVNAVIRKIISLIVLAGVLFGLWWGLRFTLYRTAGFAIWKKVDGVVIYRSGHSIFFRAEKGGDAFTGEISENLYEDGVLTGFIKYTFDGVDLVSMERFSVDENGNETLREKRVAENGRIVEVTSYDRNGDEYMNTKYRYDWLGRVKSGEMIAETDDKTIEVPIVFNYHWYGPIESMVIDYEKDGRKLYQQHIFNSDSRVEVFVYETEDYYERIVYEYVTKEDETKGMTSGFTVYNKNGRQIRKCTISYDGDYKPSYSFQWN